MGEDEEGGWIAGERAAVAVVAAEVVVGDSKCTLVSRTFRYLYQLASKSLFLCPDRNCLQQNTFRVLLSSFTCYLYVATRPLFLIYESEYFAADPRQSAYIDLARLMFERGRLIWHSWVPN